MDSLQCIIDNGIMKPYLRGMDINFTKTHKEFDIYKCDTCGLEAVYPQLSNEELYEFYPDQYYSYDKPTKKHRFTLLREKTFLSRIYGKNNIYTFLFGTRLLSYPTELKEGGHYLDIGCGAGNHFEIIESTGWKCKGFEFGDPSDSTDAIVKSDHIKNIDREGQKYNMVTMRAVFEHLSDPAGYLDIIHAISTEDMKLVINIPNTKSRYASLFGKRRYNRDIPRHLYNYNPQNITKLFKDHGFSVNKVHHIGSGGFALTISTYLNYLFNNRLPLLFHIFFIIPFIPIDLLSNLFKRGDLIILEASK